MNNKIRIKKEDSESQKKVRGFWIWFTTWVSQDDIRNSYFNKEYLANTEKDFKNNIKFYDAQYILYYGKEFPGLNIILDNVNEKDIKDILEKKKKKWILNEKQGDFAIEVNTHLKQADIYYQIDDVKAKANFNNKREDIFVLVKFVQDPVMIKEMQIDIVNILTIMQRNIIYRGVPENILNDGLRDGLKITRRYQVHDQTRQGESESGKEAGELDILLSTKEEDLPISVIEALILNRLDKNNLKKHIDKALTKYDPNGCPVIVIIIYSRNDNFENLANSITNYLKEYEFPYNIKEEFQEVDSGYTESRHWKLELIRSKKSVSVHIYDFNMSDKVSQDIDCHNETH